jgi:hypothetical protein
MRTYEVSYRGEDSISVKAENIEHAYLEFLGSGGEPKENAIRVTRGKLSKGGEMKVFSVPHIHPQKARLEAEKADELKREKKLKAEKADELKREKKLKAEQEKREKERKAEEKRRKAEEERKSKSRGMVEKLVEIGFRSLDNQDISWIVEIVDTALRQPSDLVSEELALVETALSDSATYRYLTMRNSSLAMENQAVIAKNQEVMAKNLSTMAKSLGTKLSKISSTTGGIRAGTTFAGLAAAKHLGEEMAEDF